MKLLKKNILTIALIIMMLASCNENQPDKKNDADIPVYKGDLREMNYTPEKTVFRIWAPSADKAEVLIYKDGLGGAPVDRKYLKKDVEGTWATAMDGDMKGLFYTFRIKYDGKWLAETPGIFATAVGVNGKRAAIVDLGETNPPGWENDRKPRLRNYNDIIIYELQVRDISIASNSGIVHKGKFTGLAETGTVSPEGEKTGLDHIRELGVTHVHLLPVFDFRSIDETKLSENKYNWGYDPQNYNVPEGSFSTDPYDPEVRIREFKEMIRAFHKKGIRVVMDVVYNHTGETENSNFNLLVPGYYYRHNADGTWSDASACGNETASERPMMRRFMIESLKYWVNEYHVDGFRFDLMGIHDIETMNAISRELHHIDPSLFLYGEGWTAGSSPLPEKELALKKYTYRLDSIAAFSDDLRDAVKGAWNNDTSRGFVSGAHGMEESIMFGVVASTRHPQVDYALVNYSKAPWAAQPFQTINYVSCHDNHTLWDKLKISSPDASRATRIKMDKLANTIVLTSQGVPFLHAGVDFLRSKKGVENAYNAPDSINEINWSLKHTNREVFDYYCGLIQMRRNHPAFRMNSTADIKKNLEFIDAGTPGVVAFLLKHNANGDSWRNILVIYNGNQKPEMVGIPQKNWTLVLNGNGYRKNGYMIINDDRVSVPATSAIVLAEIVAGQN